MTLKEKIEALKFKYESYGCQLALNDVIKLLEEHPQGDERSVGSICAEALDRVMHRWINRGADKTKEALGPRDTAIFILDTYRKELCHQPPADIAHQAAGVEYKVTNAIFLKLESLGVDLPLKEAGSIYEAIRPYLTPVSAQPTLGGESNLQPLELSELESRIAGWEEWIECEPPNIKSTLEAATLIHELYRLIRAPSAEACRKAFERETGLIWGEKDGEYAQDHFVGGWKAALEEKK